MTAYFVVDFTLKEQMMDLFLSEATDPWSRTFDVFFDYFQNALKLHSNVDASLNRMNIKIQVYFQANYSLFMSSWFFSVSHKVFIFSTWSLICFQFVVWEKEKVVASKYGLLLIHVNCRRYNRQTILLVVFKMSLLKLSTKYIC